MMASMPAWARLIQVIANAICGMLLVLSLPLIIDVLFEFPPWGWCFLVVAGVYFVIVIAAMNIEHRAGRIAALRFLAMVLTLAFYSILLTGFHAGSPTPAYLKWILDTLVGLLCAIQLSAIAVTYCFASHAPGRCTICGYDLRGSGSLRCPECGTERDTVGSAN